jgi:hypothetical protein
MVRFSLIAFLGKNKNKIAQLKTIGEIRKNVEKNHNSFDMLINFGDNMFANSD